MYWAHGRIIVTICVTSSVTVCFFALWILMPFSDFVLYVQMSHSNTF